MSVARIEGRNAVVEALRAGQPVRRIVTAQGTKPDRVLDEIARRAREAGIPVETRSRRELDAMSERGAHQGVIAEAAPFEFAPLGDVLRATQDKRSSLVVALDGVTDPGNFGAIVRTAEVAGADAVLVPARRSAAITPGAYKAAAGAFAYMPIARETNLVRALQQLKDAGYWIAGASEDASEPVWSAPIEGRLVLVMGAEGEGLSRLVAETCDFLVSLPQAGRVSSLNVAQAAAVLIYEWVRRSPETP